jgi:hypothetical protein
LEYKNVVLSCQGNVNTKTMRTIDQKLNYKLVTAPSGKPVLSNVFEKLKVGFIGVIPVRKRRQ